MGPDTIVMVLQPYNQKGYAELLQQGTATSLGDGVLLVQGPKPPPGFGPAPRLDAPSLGLLSRNTALAFLLLLVVGLGWAAGLLPGLDLIEHVALAPAIGMSILVAVGVAVGLMGVVLLGGGGVALTVVVALAGWVVVWVRRMRRTAGPTPASTPEPAV